MPIEYADSRLEKKKFGHFSLPLPLLLDISLRQCLIICVSALYIHRRHEHMDTTHSDHLSSHLLLHYYVPQSETAY